MKTWRKKKIFKTVWFTLAILFFIWNWTTFQSRNLPDDTFTNTTLVTVTETDDQFIFQPKDSIHNLKVIFFQGGLTDPKAYAPICRKLAEHGFATHLIKMNWRMPQFDYQKTSELLDLKNGNYVIGGHSQGGKMAAQSIFDNPVQYKGLFLLGTSHPRDISLSVLDIPCVKLYAEHDGLASMAEVMENKTNLPFTSKLILVKGGNHSQFGYLGKLLMDNKATISVEEQQQQTLTYLLEFLHEILKPRNTF